MAANPRRVRVPYVDKLALALELRRTRRGRRKPSPELVAMLSAIAEGVHLRHRYCPDRDDWVQDCLLHVLSGNALKRIDPDANPFGYLVTTFRRFGWKLAGKASREAERFREYAAEVVGSTPNPAELERHQADDPDPPHDPDPPADPTPVPAPRNPDAPTLSAAALPAAADPVRPVRRRHRRRLAAV